MKAPDVKLFTRLHSSLDSSVRYSCLWGTLPGTPGEWRNW